MKLLLTSAGIKNKSIADAMFDLVQKKPSDITLAFIPTASNVELGDKDWLIEDLINLKNLGLKMIDIVDISALPREKWLPRLESADVLFFEGGNSYHLMEWIRKSGLEKDLPHLLESRVYVGSSAGSMVTNKDLALKLSQELYGEDLERTDLMAGLCFVDFYLLPHLYSPYFLLRNKENIETAIRGMKEVVYAMDDNSAIKIDGDDIKIVSEGKYLVFNEKVKS